MNSLGWFLMIFILMVLTTCSICMVKETDRLTNAKCYEQTKSEKCWGMNGN